ncbi:MAG: glycosyltransferase family 2 protein [Flavobacteriales bacterium]|nr:glycosyltransferase family 2 protein [Flavobacteriales bacterium]
MHQSIPNMDALVTVLLPAYNAEKYVSEAIKSILQQSYTKFELLIINDGSTDRTKEIILSFNDARITYVENEKNLGLIATLNKGIELIGTKYILRADADDICLPTRIEKQVRFMELNPEIGICGSWFDNFGSYEGAGARYAAEHQQIRFKQLYQIHISHGTSIIRSAVLKEHQIQFDPQFPHAEDYDIFDRLGNVTRLSNLQEVLYLVRSHGNKVSNLFSNKQEESSTNVKLRIFKTIGMQVSVADLQLYRGLCHQEYEAVLEHTNRVASMVTELYWASLSSGYFSKPFIAKNCSVLLTNLMLNGGYRKKGSSRLIFESPFLSLAQKLSLVLKTTAKNLLN